jgi:hypothetical protein
MLHRFITNAPPGMVVNHINNNQLDNRRCNLEVCTQKHNMRNPNNRKPTRKAPMKLQENNETGYYCIHFNHRTQQFVVRVGRKQWGTYDHIRDAVARYNEVAKMLYGDLAALQEFRDNVGKERAAEAAERQKHRTGNTHQTGWAKSGIKGVYIYPRGRKFLALTRIGGTVKHLGLYPTRDAAIEAGRQLTAQAS